LTVLNLLGRFPWSDKTVKRRLYKVKHIQKEYRVNLPQRLYKELYDTRNEFLHGNPISTNRLHPFRQKDKPGITRFAPLLYKIALLSYLDKYKDKKTGKDTALPNCCTSGVYPKPSSRRSDNNGM